MAEAALSFVLQQLYLLGTEEICLLKGLRSDFSNIQHELETIYAFLKNADRRAGYEGDTNYRIKTWVKQVREVSFCIEDVIDKYIKDVARYRCIDSLPTIALKPKTLMSRHRIASEIRDIKSIVREIKDRSTRYDFQSSSNNSREASDNSCWSDPRMDSHFIEETGLVGFESPREELIGFLTQGTQQLSVFSVVGMGGLGKTTLAKHVYDNPQVQEHFKCTCFLTVSQSYTVKELLINMVKKFCEDANDPLPQGLHKKDDNSLVTKVRKFLESKKYMYLILFDDVWKQDFSDEIKHALPNNNNGSRIVITTRIMHVAECFNKSFLGRVHELQHLLPEQAFKLFCMKAFRFEPSQQCPPELEFMSKEIVQKCGGLPLAIVAIGGLLTTKAKEMIEWRQVCEDLTMEIERTPYLNALTRILSLSYDDLPPNLKSCMLYFGMYPEDYSIKCTRLTGQWIAEGFIQNEGQRPVEEVAERSLRDLAHRSLVKVSKVGRNGKVKSCQVHDLLRKVIIRRMKELNFCHVMHEDDELETVGITRRFSVANFSDIVLSRTRLFGIRAIFVFSKSELPAYFVPKLSTKFKLLKVLDFQGTSLNHVPDNLGKLFLLRYLNLSHTQVEVLPKSIGKLLNLETLDLRQTKVRELPREITQLLKLRLLSVYYRKIEGQKCIRVSDA
ncbi:unnamed protein product [Sphenostylis stenocarpa]|uniref:Uncharacterized protein n=1 Tax=Sphenostylis stenocarpa TaxID=92480 RepID=A0AA86SUH8_9FABA|nr:unnamed protein product [Sphenostylis stenocarpa]